MKNGSVDLDRISEYLDFARERPELFDSPPGAVRILLDPEQIREVEAMVSRRLAAQGLPVEGARVGIVFRDPWFYVVRDAVEFPDGSRRTHARSINRTGNGAAVLPVLGGRIVLTRQFRHAVRRWMLEIPRGAIEPGQSPEDAARAEVAEEIGGEIAAIVPMCFVHGSTNLYFNGAHLFFAQIDRVGEPQISEGIVSIVQLSVSEFESLLLGGQITDSFTIAAYAHARLRGLV